MITIESMTAGALRRGGLEGGRLTLLILDTVRRRQPSRRALEMAAGSELGVKHPAYDGTSPSRYPPPGIRSDPRGTLVCRVDLSRGTWWEDGVLYGAFPETIRNAAVGRRLGDVLMHPDTDPEAVTRRPERSDALLQVDRTLVHLTPPTIGERLSHPWYRLRLRIAECMTESTIPSGMRMTATLVALGSAIIAAMITGLAASDATSWVAAAAMWVGAGYCTLTAWGAWRPRRFSLLHGMTAEARHEGTLQTRQAERKTS